MVLTETTFSNIWNTPPSTTPADSTWSAWKGNGRDVVIQRINLQPLFNQLILINHDAAGAATFSIDHTNVTVVPTIGTGWNSYYLSGSIVGLCNSNGIPMTRSMLTCNISYVFESGVWNAQIINGTQSTNATGLTTNASSFFNSMWNPQANSAGGKGALTNPSVLASMANFMLDYTLYANENPHNST